MLRSMNRQSVIIFVTSHPDFVFQGYEVRALNYILKPYEPSKILSVLKTALNELELTAEKYYVIEQRSGSIRVPLSQIQYIFSERPTPFTESFAIWRMRLGKPLPEATADIW